MVAAAHSELGDSTDSELDREADGVARGPQVLRSHKRDVVASTLRSDGRQALSTAGKVGAAAFKSQRVLAEAAKEAHAIRTRSAFIDAGEDDGGSLVRRLARLGSSKFKAAAARVALAAVATTSRHKYSQSRKFAIPIQDVHGPGGNAQRPTSTTAKGAATRRSVGGGNGLSGPSDVSRHGIGTPLVRQRGRRPAIADEVDDDDDDDNNDDNSGADADAGAGGRRRRRVSGGSDTGDSTLPGPTLPSGPRGERVTHAGSTLWGDDALLPVAQDAWETDHHPLLGWVPLDDGWIEATLAPFPLVPVAVPPTSSSVGESGTVSGAPADLSAHVILGDGPGIHSCGPINLGAHRFYIKVAPHGLGAGAGTHVSAFLSAVPEDMGLGDPSVEGLSCSMAFSISVLRTSTASEAPASRVPTSDAAAVARSAVSATSAWESRVIEHTFTHRSTFAKVEQLVPIARVRDYLSEETNRSLRIRVSLRRVVTRFDWSVERFFEIVRRVESPRFVVSGGEWSVQLIPTVVAETQAGDVDDPGLMAGGGRSTATRGARTRRHKALGAVRADGTHITAFMHLNHLRYRSQNASGARAHGCAITAGGARFALTDRPCRVDGGWGASWFVPLADAHPGSGAVRVRVELHSASTLYDWALSTMLRVRHRMVLDNYHFDVHADDNGLVMRFLPHAADVVVRVKGQFTLVSRDGAGGGAPTAAAGVRRASNGGGGGGRAPSASDNAPVRDLGQFQFDFSVLRDRHTHAAPVLDLFSAGLGDMVLRLECTSIQAWRDGSAVWVGAVCGRGSGEVTRLKAMSSLAREARLVPVLQDAWYGARATAMRLATDVRQLSEVQRRLEDDNSVLRLQVADLVRQVASARSAAVAAVADDAERDFAVLTQSRPPPWGALDMWINGKLPSSRAYKRARAFLMALVVAMRSSSGLQVVDVVLTGSLHRGTSVAGQLSTHLYVALSAAAAAHVEQAAALASNVIERACTRPIKWTAAAAGSASAGVSAGDAAAAAATAGGRDKGSPSRHTRHRRERSCTISFTADDVAARVSFVDPPTAEEAECAAAVLAARVDGGGRGAGHESSIAGALPPMPPAPASRRYRDNGRSHGGADREPATFRAALRAMRHDAFVRDYIARASAGASGETSDVLRRVVTALKRWSTEQPWSIKSASRGAPSGFLLECVVIDTHARFASTDPIGASRTADLLRAVFERLAAWDAIEVTWGVSPMAFGFKYVGGEPVVVDPTDFTVNLALSVGAGTSYRLREYALAALMTLRK